MVKFKGVPFSNFFGKNRPSSGRRFFGQAFLVGARQRRREANFQNCCGRAPTPVFGYASWGPGAPETTFFANVQIFKVRQCNLLRVCKKKHPAGGLCRQRAPRGPFLLRPSGNRRGSGQRRDQIRKPGARFRMASRLPAAAAQNARAWPSGWVFAVAESLC